MCYYAQLRDYMKASDSYLALSIGNAAWPIGITGVALHERKGNDKIASSEIPHVLNDEVKRKVLFYNNSGFKVSRDYYHLHNLNGQQRLDQK